MNKKHKILFDNKSSFKEINMPIYGMNEFINKNINEKQFSITSENEKIISKINVLILLIIINNFLILQNLKINVYIII